MCRHRDVEERLSRPSSNVTLTTYIGLAVLKHHVVTQST